MSKRKPISKGLRFAVLHRDNFTCRYCGARPPEAVLHLDHQKPVVNGGENTLENLITSCSGCNLGKGTTELRRQSLGRQIGQPIRCPFADGWPFDIEDPVFFANDTWAVTAYGLECLIGFYPIDASRLNETRGNLSDWLLHLAEKERFAERYDDLEAAFRFALVQHHVSPKFDLEESVIEGRDMAHETTHWSPRP